jgi:hypothetical protein
VQKRCNDVVVYLPKGSRFDSYADLIILGCQVPVWGVLVLVQAEAYVLPLMIHIGSPPPSPARRPMSRTMKGRYVKTTSKVDHYNITPIFLDVFFG